MSALPLILSLANDLDRLSTAVTPYYYMPMTSGRRMDLEKRGSKALIGKDGFQAAIEVTHFKPNELTVKVVDNSILVEGKHEEREDDHGYIQRHFVRRYTLPKGYDPNQVQSTLSSDGVLTVSVPKPSIEDKTKERVIQIQQTGPAHLNVKENPKEDDKKEETKGKK